LALEFTVAILADHKGHKVPRAVGDEYVVDALVDVGSIVAAGSVIPAADFGLSTITCATITGYDNANGLLPQIECSATGDYESLTSIALMFTSLDGTNDSLADDGNGGSVRLRVWGNL